MLIHDVSSQSQDFYFLRGTVQSIAGEPLLYTNIGIIDTEIGTLSDQDGSFQLKTPIKHLDDTLIFSALGYKRHRLKLNEIENPFRLKIQLKEKDLLMDEVVVATEKRKQHEVRIGNGRSFLLHGNLEIDSLYAGAAYAMLIHKEAYPQMDFIHGAYLRIAKNMMPSFTVRMRILAVDSLNHNKPGEDLIQDQLVVASEMEKGWLYFPVPQTYELKANAFYLTFEWILSQKERKQIGETYRQFMERFPEKVKIDTVMVEGEPIITQFISTLLTGTIFGTTTQTKDRERFPTYSRKNSFGEWKRSGSTLSALIDLANYPKSESK